jgi:hypothetical protein
MKFPEYVPAAAQKFFSVEIRALAEALQRLELSLSNINWAEVHQRKNLSREQVQLWLDQLRTEQGHLSGRLNLIRPRPGWGTACEYAEVPHRHGSLCRGSSSEPQAQGARP